MSTQSYCQTREPVRQMITHLPQAPIMPEEPAPIRTLKSSLYAAVETYSNVHRGSGQFSQVSTQLYEQARTLVLQTLRLREASYTVVFCTRQRLQAITSQLNAGDYQAMTSQEIGLALGVCALAIRKQAIRRIRRMESGGGVVRLVSQNWTVWEHAPERLEAGTPPVLNVLAFVQALQLLQIHGLRLFLQALVEPMTADEILLGDLTNVHGIALLQQLRKSMPGKNLPAPTKMGARPYTNLDNGASTPAFAPVWEAAWHTLRQTKAVQMEVTRQVRKVIARFLGAPQTEYEQIFCSNTTEAINLAAGLLPVSNPGEELVILNTLLEHHSNELPWREVPGATLVQVGADAEGFIDLAQMEALLRSYNLEHRHGSKRIRLVAVTGASNVLGTFTDLDAVSALARRYSARLLVDGAQVVAHRPVSLVQQEIDYFAFSAHKAYAPFGSGGLLVRKSLLPTDNEGVRHLQAIQESGEENAVGIAALGKALLLLERIGMEVIAAEEAQLTSLLLDGLAELDVEVFGLKESDSRRFADKGPVVPFSLKDVPHNLAVRELAEFGAIGVRNGCFCAHLAGKHLMRISPLRERLADLGVMVLPKFTAKVLPGMIRVSIGLENDEEDIRHLLHTLRTILAQPRRWHDRAIAQMYNGTPFSRQSGAGSDIAAWIEEHNQRVFGESADYQSAAQ